MIHFNLTNYGEHPTNQNYWVFSFKRQEEAAYFEDMLVKSGIKFEKDDSGIESNEELTLYAVRTIDRKPVIQMNFQTSAHFRKPFIRHKTLRYGVLLTAAVAIILGIVGFYISTR